jgi:hypothetical protein
MDFLSLIQALDCTADGNCIDLLLHLRQKFAAVAIVETG